MSLLKGLYEAEDHACAGNIRKFNDSLWLGEAGNGIVRFTVLAAGVLLACGDPAILFVSERKGVSERRIRHIWCTAETAAFTLVGSQTRG